MNKFTSKLMLTILNEILPGLSVLIVILLIFFPFLLPFILIFVIILFGINNTPENKRKNALGHARLYLSPYTNIWNNLKLTNQNCSVELTRKKEIIVKDFKTYFNNTRKTHTIKRLNNDEDWNKLCYEFDYLTDANDVIIFFTLQGYGILTEDIVNKNTQTENTIQNDNIPNKKNNSMPILKVADDLNLIDANKTDINNASEIEITALPGISIVLSKKIIQKREEIGGFKTVDEVFDFLKLKPHFETQLRKMICVNKMQGTIRIKKYKERRIDL